MAACGRFTWTRSYACELSCRYRGFQSFFAEKVAKVRSSTADAPAPTFTQVPPGVCFQQFRPLTTNDVINAIRRLPDKSSSADPVPTSVLKQIANIIAPFIAELFNCSLRKGLFPAQLKEVFITPVLKKSGLDATNASSYRPISNLSVLSKLLERLVARQLREYLSHLYNLAFNRVIPSKLRVLSTMAT